MIQLSIKRENEERNQKILKILVLGDNNVGIPTFIKKACKGELNQPKIPLIGVDLSLKVSKDDKSDLYQIWTVKKKSWDIFKTIHFNQFEGGIVMFDVTNLESYQTVEFYIERILMYNKAFIPIAVLGNKTDLRKKNSESVMDKEAEELCIRLVDKFGKFHCEIKYFPITALEDQYVDNCFTYLSESFRNNSNYLSKI